MATKTLSSSLSLSVIGDIFGILSLNNTTVTSFSYDDTVVSSGTITTSGTATEILAAGLGHVTYVYLKNTDPTSSVATQNAAGTVENGILAPNEWMFVPVPGNVGFEVKSVSGTPIVEYVALKKV